MLCLYRGRLIRESCFHVFVQRWSNRKNVSGSKRYSASTYGSEIDLFVIGPVGKSHVARFQKFVVECECGVQAVRRVSFTQFEVIP